MLNIELGGTALGDFDLFQIAGTASLDGTLNIIMCTAVLCPTQGDFIGVVNNTFNIMTYSGLPGGLGDFFTVSEPAGYTFGNNIPFNNFYQLEITSLPVSPPPIATSPLPIIEEVLDISTDQVIVMNDFQEDILVTHAEVEVDEEEEEEKEFACR